MARIVAPNIAELLSFFDYEHLPDDLKVVSAPFGELAKELVEELQPCAELTVALRKLLEAKDCAVRARVSELRNGIKP